MTGPPGRDRTGGNQTPYKASREPLLLAVSFKFRGGWEVFFLTEVVIQEGESLEGALRRFKRRVQQADIIKEIKKHSYYMKPGERRRAKAALSRKRMRKKMRREQD